MSRKYKATGKAQPTDLCPTCRKSWENHFGPLGKELSDVGCFALLKTLLMHAFDDAKVRSKAQAVRDWASLKPNRVILIYSEASEYDYDQVVKSLIERCDLTLENVGKKKVEDVTQDELHTDTPQSQVLESY